ncbi:MAG: 5'-methylthioadenosine/adenosylhomocysteine nucleosidase [Lachnospiraceae bacterium]|nr:5'-methylthioadenosine/adenosylhomocysteine nucleosidase [Lachnospiraceae bacterium]
MIGIICALQEELKEIRSAMEPDGELSFSGVDYYLGKLEGVDVVCAVCGVGKVFAAICAQTMILKFRPELILNVGVAGSLSPSLRVADVVIARQLVQHDMDVTALGEPRGKILGSDIRFIPTTESVRDEFFSAIMTLNAAGAFGGKEIKALQGTVASGDQFISSKGQKQLIAEEFGALACEMEGAAIAQVCYVNKLPFCVIRAISDSADSSAHMDYPHFVALAALNTSKVVREFLKNRKK